MTCSEHAVQRFRTAIPTAGSPAISSGPLRRNQAARPRGARALRRDGRAGAPSARDPAIRTLYQQTTDIWQATVRGLLVKAARDGALVGSRNPDAQASLVVSALTGASMIPLSRPARLTETISELERSLGLT